MIIFDLKCAASGHVFEAWFGSSEDYESQKARGLVLCPMCGDGSVDKAVMAPRVGSKGSDGQAKEVLAALAMAQRAFMQRSEHVGQRFASEARAIHEGTAQERSIYGTASKEDVAGLLEDGITVAPLPLPIPVPGEEN